MRFLGVGCYVAHVPNLTPEKFEDIKYAPGDFQGDGLER